MNGTLRPENKTEWKIGKVSFRYSDFIFGALFLLIAAFFFGTAANGITVCDESLWQFYSFRIANGDRLFVDDWMLSNLISVFTYLPYRLFTAVSGGTEGLLLSLRFLYIGIKLIFFAYIYFTLREYGLWSVFAGVFYVGTDLFAIKTTNYYSVCVNAVLLVGMLLFVRKRRSSFSIVFAGFLFSCAVIAEPPAAIVWVVYSAIVLVFRICKKKNRPVLQAYDFIFEAKTWRLLLLGICAAVLVFAVLCALVFTGTDIRSIMTGLRSLLSYVMMQPDTGASALSARLHRVSRYLSFYGYPYGIAFLAVFMLAVPLHRFTKKFEKLLFILLSALFVLMSVKLITMPVISASPVRSTDASGECASHPLLLCLLSVVSYTFTRNKNRRLFAFLLFTFALSAVTDFFSNNSFGSVLLAGSVPAILIFRDYWTEQRAQYKDLFSKAAGPASYKTVQEVRETKRKRNAFKAFFCCLVAVACFVPAFEVFHYAYMGRFHETERCFCRSTLPLDTKIESGVLKGIVTTKDIAETYSKSVEDAATIKRLCEKGLIVVDYDTTVYLNAGVPVRSPAQHITAQDWSLEESFWKRYPEKRPDVAYVPFSSLSYLSYLDLSAEEKIAYFQKNADVEILEGSAGYILKIKQWYAD